MPEVNEIEWVGELTLGFTSEEGERCLRLDGVKVSELISQALDFPNEEEFDVMFRRLEQMRENGVRPLEGEPDVMREAGRYKISIEKVE